MLSGSAPGGGRTKDFPTSDAAREAISKLPREQVLADLAATASYVRALPVGERQARRGGFCWGGARTWDAANTVDGLTAAFAVLRHRPVHRRRRDRDRGAGVRFLRRR